MTPCAGTFGRWFGHKFRPRYSEGAPLITSIDEGPVHAVISLVEASKPRTYHGDVCERCGQQRGCVK